MRTLIYIPIIHTDPDLGSLVSDVEEKASALLGERWREHKKIVIQYWQEIVKYFSRINAGSAFGREKKKLKGVKIFQDGLPAGGKTALAIVNKIAKTGSPNYRLLKKLISQGANLLKTEDPALLKQEYQLTKNLVAKKNLVSALVAFLNYELKKGRLLKARDEFIARQINQNLKEGETGVCFLGAYHQVLPKLAKNIKVILFKDPDKVREYYKCLTSGKDTSEVKKLA